MNPPSNNTPTTEISLRTLTLSAVRFDYNDRPAVDAVSFQVTPGELLAIVGPNGCGKSTLLKLIIGSLRPKSGAIHIDGTPIEKLSRTAAARRIALVPQMAGLSGAADAGLGGGFTVRQMVLMARHSAHAAEAGLLAMGFETADDRGIADRALWAMDVHHLADRPIDTLSGGERQRVAIARAFTQQTPAILLDEPTSALDLFHQLELMTQLKELTTSGKIIVMVTHDLNLAARWASRVIIMDQARIVADGPPAAVLTAQLLEPVYRVKIEITADGDLRFSRAAR